MQNLSPNPNGVTRQFERRPYSKPIDFSVSSRESREQKWLNLKGKAIDISEAGIGIQTDYPLAPGHMLWFNEGIENKAGFVRWCMQLDNDYRVGVQLDRKHVKHLDEETALFNKQLEEIEKRCLNPEENTDRLLNDITVAISDVLRACEEFEREVQDKDIIRDARVRFHRKTNPILSKSYCINRARTWPQGYQGDYKTMEIIYKNMPLSENIGYFLDLYSLNLSLSIGVRNRIKKLEEILREEISVRKQPSVLNIACGSCREVFILSP
ncbi:MAG: PilZ domain-containing protein, partial [Nitrospirota bacterium]|nr:PilZ domain-containing protein [Nitrospirota bacterium]